MLLLPCAAAVLTAGAAPLLAQPAAAPAPSTSVRQATTLPVELRLSTRRARPGAEVEITVLNRAEAEYAFVACTRMLERAVRGGWRLVEEAPRACDATPTSLPPGTSRRATVTLPDAMPPGRYRIVLPVTREGPPATARLRVLSRPLTVTR